MTLLNETDILSQYLEKEVRRGCWEKGEWVLPQEAGGKEDCEAAQAARHVFWGLCGHGPALRTAARSPPLSPSPLCPSRTASSTPWCSTPCRRRCSPTRARSALGANTKLRSQIAWPRVSGGTGVWLLA